MYMRDLVDKLLKNRILTKEEFIQLISGRTPEPKSISI